MTPSAEIARITNRPDAFPNGILSVFYIELETWNEAESFGRRLRELVRAGVKAGLEADFESETISEADVPAWAADAWVEASLGTRRIGAKRSGRYRTFCTRSRRVSAVGPGGT